MTVNRNGVDQGAVSKRTVTAKGNLIVGTANSVVSNLAVGNDGEQIVADSSTSTGLRYTAGNPIANPVINSCFDIWQRGTSFTPNATIYMADRWQMFVGTTGTTVTRQTTNDTTNLPFIQYCMRIARNSGVTNTDVRYLLSAMETVNSIPFAGRTITFSFYARAGANFSGSVTARVGSGTGTDQNPFVVYTGDSTVASGVPTLTTTWQRFTYTGTMSASATEFYVSFNWTPSGTAGANDYYEVTGAQVDIGSVALPVRRNGATIQGELAACQRYFERMQSGGVDAPFGMGVAYSSSAPLIYVQHQTPKRVVPSYAFAGTWELIGGNTIITMTSPLASGNAVSVFGFQMSGTASGMTVGHAQLLRSGIDTPYIDISAEL